MGIRDLFFNIVAKDQTGAAFGAVKSELRQVDGLAASAGERLNRIGRSAVKTGAAMTGITAPITFMFRDSLQLYDQQERALAKVRKGIESTGGSAGFAATDLFEVASALQGVTRFGDEVILNDVTAQLLTFTNIAGDQFLMAQERALDLATVLDGDLQSASIMVGKALNDPVKGLTAMSRAGVTFSEEQGEVIKTLAETGKMAEAQTMILAELEKQYGGQARAAAEAGMGAMDQLSNSFGDLKETVGGVLSEILPPVVDFFKTAIDGFQALPAPVQKFTVIAAGLGLVLGPLVGILGLVAVGVSAMSAPVLVGVAAFGALTAGVIAFGPEALAFAGTVKDNIVSGAQAAWDTVIGFKDGVLETATALRNDLVTGALLAWDTVLGLKDGVAATALSLRDDLVSATGAAWDAALTLKTGVVDAFGAIKDYVLSTVDAVGSYLTGKLTDVLDAVGRKVEWVEAKFAWLYNEVVGNSWIPDMVDEVGEHMARLDPLMVAKADQTTSAVSSAFEGLGGNVTSVLAQMTRDGEFSWQSLSDVYLQAGDRLVNDLLTQVFSPIGDMVQNVFNSLSGGSSGGGGGFLGNILSGAGGFFSGLLGFDTGGEMAVGGRAGIDRNVAAFKVSADENIKVVKRGNPDTGRPVNVYIQTPNPGAFNASKGQMSAQIAQAVARGNRFA